MLPKLLVLIHLGTAAVVNAKICGSAGYTTSTDAYYFDDSNSQGSLSSCSKLCTDDTACQSFSISSTTCELFNVPVSSNFAADDSSPYLFYDSSCSTATTSTSAAAATSSVIIPPGCNVPGSRTVTSFSWFNSSHNCDCAASRPDVGDGTGCLDPNGQWCDPSVNATDCTHCGIGVCMTGLPPQPVGYGPPDDVKFVFSDGTSCEQANPQGFRNFEVGEGHMNCGGASTQMGFTANSEAASSTGVVSYDSLISCSDGKSVWASYNASFPISCSHDAGHNATCTTQGSIYMPLIAVSMTG